MPLIDNFNARFLLGVPAMDRSHREMVDLINEMDGAGDATFAYLFADLVNHTRAHFASEEVMMRESRFPGMAEHLEEHAQVLRQLERFIGRLGGTRLAQARSYVREQIPDWFARHWSTMDSALAAHLNGARARIPLTT